MLPEVDRLRDIYERSFKEHGDTALGFGWRDEAGKTKRLDIIAKTIEWDADQIELSDSHHAPTLLDVGCGTGELLRQLWRHVSLPVQYVGIDMVPDMVNVAKDKWLDPNMLDMLHKHDGSNERWNYPTPRFIMDDFLTVPAFPDTYDYVVCSGAMNFLPEPVQFRYVSKMCLVAKRMVALNAQKVSIQTAQVWAGYFGVKEFQIRVGYLPDDITVTFWK